MVKEIAESSKREGRYFSRLPEMTEETKNFLRGSADFFGLNYYTSRLLTVDKSPRNYSDTPAWYKDSRNLIDVDKKWKRGKSVWLFSVPEGLRDLLKWIKDEYENPITLVTENGYSDEGEMEDDGRIEYFKSHLTSVSKAIKEDGCNIVGYTAWSLLDSFEWDRGYTEKFGLFSVNFTSAEKERTAKKSAKWISKVIKSKRIGS
jgi:beta-glucosidase/6-phospho-beta-glucosidase/beta-galactosidase